MMGKQGQEARGLQTLARVHGCGSLVDGCLRESRSLPRSGGSRAGAKAPLGRGVRGMKSPRSGKPEKVNNLAGYGAESPLTGGCNGGGAPLAKMSRQAVRRNYRRTSCARSELQLRSPCVLRSDDGWIKESLTPKHAINHRSFAAAQERNLRDYRDAQGVRDGLSGASGRRGEA